MIAVCKSYHVTAKQQAQKHVQVYTMHLKVSKNSSVKVITNETSIDNDWVKENFRTKGIAFIPTTAMKVSMKFVLEHVYNEQ